MTKLLITCAAALLTVSAIAQESPAAKKAPAKKQPPQNAMPAVKPSPEMQKMMKMFVGKWTAVVKTEAMAGMPASEAKGEATFRKGPGGMSLVEEFRSTGAMGKFSGHGVTYWDEKAKNYTGLWCDSMTPGGCSAAGTSKWEGDNIVGYMEMPDETGKLAKYRMTYSDMKPDSVTFTMEAPDASGGYKKAMSIVYTRAAAAPATPAAKRNRAFVFRLSAFVFRLSAVGCRVWASGECSEPRLFGGRADSPSHRSSRS